MVCHPQSISLIFLGVYQVLCGGNIYTGLCTFVYAESGSAPLFMQSQVWFGGRTPESLSLAGGFARTAPDV